MKGRTTSSEKQDGFSEVCKAMRRVLVIGSPGSGKSTFARALHEKTKLPLYYLDMIWHQPDHTTVPEAEFDEQLREILARPRWIIDGNYKRTIALRLAKADTVFFFDLPVELCLKGIWDRLGTVRVDMPWEPETSLDPLFEQYVADFPQTVTPVLYELLEGARREKWVFVFHSREEAHQFLSSC